MARVDELLPALAVESLDQDGILMPEQKNCVLEMDVLVAEMA